ncbi:DUF6538 domain-containing protein [Serratia sp. D1N4]
MCTHLVKRGSRYYFRRRIPLSLISHFQRTEILKALGTSNRFEAERLVRLEGYRLRLPPIYAQNHQRILF